MATKKRRLERMVEAAQVCSWCLQDGEWITGYHIAFWMGMRPSTHHRKILDHATSIGWLKEKKIEHRPNLQKNVYQVTPTGRQVANSHHMARLPDIDNV